MLNNKLMKRTLLFSALFVGGILIAQNSDAKITVTEVQKEFKYKKYSPQILENFVNQISEIEQKPTITEFIPGEIIGWNNDRSTGSTEEIFWIKNGKLNPISTVPENENFFKKINKYAPKEKEFDIYKWSTKTYEGKILKKLTDGSFLINIGLTLFEKGTNDDFNNGIGEYEVEYKTKDFKNFIPLKLREKEKNNAKWITIK
ncbi:MAG: hypothetical protein BGO40_03550 [Chryseobacterium sp. 39-10]|nr:MAG: hypothetical protein BGO40_03550 [Chryseobacterium sp. 39-10]